MPSGTELLTDPVSGTEYRVVRGGDRAVVIMHGGHMGANIEVGEQLFLDRGNTIVVPSRPGYGATPALVGGGRSGFVDVVAKLVTDLGCSSVEAVVGISAGGLRRSRWRPGIRPWSIG